MEVKRNIYKLLADDLRRPEVSVILGPRQVGKTYLLKMLEQNARTEGLRTRYFNLELPHDLRLFDKDEDELLQMLTTDLDVVFIDEFQYLPNASKLFKAVYDMGGKTKIVVTGSSAIEMHRHLKESLAGRRLAVRLMPLSFDEYLQTGKDSRALLDEYLVFGGLPGLIHHEVPDEKIRLLNEILETYIQKDIKALIREENIRAFNSLLYLLAERQGSLISTSGLANDIGLSTRTLERHISIMEQTYVLYSVYSYSGNIGNELKKSRKIYFYDLGIRNALLRDFSLAGERKDIGTLCESFAAVQLTSCLKPNMELKFWRNKAGQEIDFVLLKNRKPLLIEIKTTMNAPETPAAIKIFMKNYPETTGAIVYSTSLHADAEYLGKPVLFRKLEAMFQDELIDAW
ncbi:MAG: ATP-binding protein [Pseudomonadota bacterium]|nr:ATP-binding protein [Pseudomonadota bacterium]